MLAEEVLTRSAIFFFFFFFFFFSRRGNGDSPRLAVVPSVADRDGNGDSPQQRGQSPVEASYFHQRKLANGGAMRRLRWFMTIVSLLVATPTLAQFAPPPPTPEQLEAAIKEDQLGDAKCGIPRNAADEYRPTPAFPAKPAHLACRARSHTRSRSLRQASITLRDRVPADGRMLLTIRSGGMRLVSRDGPVSEPLTGTPTLTNPPRLGGMQDVILDRDFAKNRTLYFSYAIRRKTVPTWSVAS